MREAFSEGEFIIKPFALCGEREMLGSRACMRRNFIFCFVYCTRSLAIRVRFCGLSIPCRLCCAKCVNVDRCASFRRTLFFTKMSNFLWYECVLCVTYVPYLRDSRYNREGTSERGNERSHERPCQISTYVKLVLGRKRRGIPWSDTIIVLAARITSHHSCEACIPHQHLLHSRDMSLFQS